MVHRKQNPFFVEEVPREKLEETIEQRLGFFRADHQRMTALGFKCLSPYCQYVVRKGRQTVLKVERFNNKNIFPHDGLNNGSTVSGKWIPQFCGRVDMSLGDHVLRVLRSIEIDVWLEAFNVKREDFLKKLPRELGREVPEQSRVERL